MSNSLRDPNNDALLERLRALTRSQADSGAWTVTRFEWANPADRDELAALVVSDRVLTCQDTILDQLREWLTSAAPARGLRDELLDAAVREKVRGDPTAYGTWVFYPWARRLVHVLPASEYRQLRADRNRYKITPAEAARLRAAHIGVVGLSVGQSAAITCALEGIGGSFRLADFDLLSLSNLNRLRAGAHELGLPKVVIAARELAEIDPYLEISIFPQGIVADNLDRFLAGPPKLDLLVEECDDLVMKVRLRERCRELGIPVLMDTSDRGLLDVERFDRETDRPVFHGLAGDVRADQLAALARRDKLPFMLRILDGDRLSPRLGASMLEIDETISTWPQLASGVALGGALIADTARRILLGQMTQSGRFYVDLEELVRDGAGELAVPVAQAEPEAPRPAPPSPPSLARSDATASVAALRDAVAWAVLAPSGGNCQPWRFEIARGTIVCRRDPSRTQPFIDAHGGTHVALGAAVENLEIAAAAMGLGVAIEPFPDPADPDNVCRVLLSRDRPRAHGAERLPIVAQRMTNRRLGERRPLADADRDALLAAVAEPRAHLHLVREDDEIHEVGRLMGLGDQIAFLSRVLHREITSEFRWTLKEALERRDGFDVDTLELTPADRAAMRILSRWPVMEVLGTIGEGRALQTPARKAVASSAAVAVISVEGTGPDAYFLGGRVMQRVWLEATARSLAVHPMTGTAYLLAELARAGGVFSASERERVAALGVSWRRVFPLPPGWCEPMILRLAYAGPASARSVRRALDDVVVIAEESCK